MDAMSDGRNIPVADLLAQTGWMRALARSLVADEALAEDLVQESLLRAVERPPRQSGALGPWLRTVLSRLVEQILEFGAGLGPLTFQGRLLGRDEKPLDRVRLTLRPEFEWAYTEFTATIAHDGRFHFLGLRPGRYRVEAADRSGRKAALPPLSIEADLERDLVAALGD